LQWLRRALFTGKTDEKAPLLSWEEIHFLKRPDRFEIQEDVQAQKRVNRKCNVPPSGLLEYLPTYLRIYLYQFSSGPLITGFQSP
jgi:hypothetical protein